MKNGNFHFENLVIGHFTWGKVYLKDYHKNWYGNIWFGMVFGLWNSENTSNSCLPVPSLSCSSDPCSLSSDHTLFLTESSPICIMHLSCSGAKVIFSSHFDKFSTMMGRAWGWGMSQNTLYAELMQHETCSLDLIFKQIVVVQINRLYTNDINTISRIRSCFNDNFIVKKKFWNRKIKES